MTRCKRPVTGSCQHRTLATLPKAFRVEPGCMLTRGRQNPCRCIWHTPKILANFLESENLVCSAMAETKAELDLVWVPSIFGSIVRGLFSGHLSYIIRGM